MAKVTAGIGGRGTVTSIDRKRHPKSHFEMTGMNIKRADDGSFVIEHRRQLKKKYDDSEEYIGSYREPETHTAKDESELKSHIAKYMGGVGKESAAEEVAEGDD